MGNNKGGTGQDCLKACVMIFIGAVLFDGFIVYPNLALALLILAFIVFGIGSGIRSLARLAHGRN